MYNTQIYWCVDVVCTGILTKLKLSQRQACDCKTSHLSTASRVINNSLTRISEHRQFFQHKSVYSISESWCQFLIFWFYYVFFFFIITIIINNHMMLEIAQLSKNHILTKQMGNWLFVLHLLVERTTNVRKYESLL